MRKCRVLGERRAGQAGQGVGVGPRLASVRIPRKQLGKLPGGDQRLAGVPESDEAASKRQLGRGISRVKAEGLPGRFDRLLGFPGGQALHGRGANPGRLPRIAVSQAAVLHR